MILSTSNDRGDATAGLTALMSANAKSVVAVFGGTLPNSFNADATHKGEPGTAADGSFLGDPAVTVSDATGKQVFQAQCDGPWVLIDLPAGSYKVHSTGEKGQYSKDFDIAVKAGAQTSKTIRLP